MKTEKTFIIKVKVDGGTWQRLSKQAKVFGDSWQEAKREFSKWIYNWLSNEDTDRANEALKQLPDRLDTFRWDNKTYTIRNVSYYENGKRY